MSFRTLREWVESQPYGELQRLSDVSGLSRATVVRARDGRKLRLASATLLSEATGGRVPVQALTDELSTLQNRAAVRAKGRRARGGEVAA